MNYFIQSLRWQDPEAELALRIRMKVFVEEQDVPEGEEVDSTDETALHVLAVSEEGEAAGTARFYDDEPGVGRIGRMAVLPEHRGNGAGRKLMEGLIHEAKRRGYHRLVLAAQIEAIPFYEKTGFQTTGEEFMECGIPHVMMEMAVDA